jgi:anaerobic nitric oxide reductase transcription regulator
VLEVLLEIALDLCANLAAEDRYRRLAAAVRRLLPCDSVAILRLEQRTLVPVAMEGLVPEAMGRRFHPAEHPRLAQALGGVGPIRFDDRLPDPFDGLIEGGHALSRVHACIGCPLAVGGEVIGVLAVDALDPHAFDHLSDDVLATLAALAAAAMRTAGLIEALERVASHQTQVARQLGADALRQGGGAEILGLSPAMRRVRDEVALLAASELAVLITGETGAGKEVVARAIHAASPRKDQPLIDVNCAALPESIAESELFGHVRGAFTGAVDHRAGKFEVAAGGTLFLDEIGELPLSIQPKLLRALQSGEVQRVGSDKRVRVDVRILAATNRNLGEEVSAGRFRADLYHRLSVYPIHVPPLRERREDIVLLAGFFLDMARARLGLGALRLDAAARAALEAYDWPGNVRELEHVLTRAALRASRGRGRETLVLEPEHLDLPAAVPEGPRASGPAPARGAPALGAKASALGPETPAEPTEPTQIDPALPLRAAIDEFQRRRILDAVARAGGNWAEAARGLGLGRANLHRLARRLGLATH